MISTTGPDGITYTWHDDRNEILRIGAYCAKDVEVETAIDAVLLQHTARERRVWELDQLINERGVSLDLDLARAAVDVIEVAKASLHERMSEITGGAVPKCSQVAKLVEWINSRGIPCTSAASGLQDELILQAETLNDTAVVEAIELRRQSGKGTPTSKYQTMLDCANADRKARGQLNYSGATTTGRWAGRLIQFQNMPGVDEDVDGSNVRAAVAVLGTPGLSPEERCQAIGILCGSVLPVLSKCLRQMLMSSPGHRFIGGDLSNIEGCVAAWITDESWKTEAYREYQAGRGADLYKVAYSRAFDTPVSEVSQSQRQVGKVAELSLAYQGSVGAFLKMLTKYRKKPSSIVGPVRAALSEEVWSGTQAKMRRPGTPTFGLAPDDWTALRATVDGWRAAHPAVVAAWWALQDAAIEGVASPGTVVRCLGDRIAYVSARQVLWCMLPSGRTLAYHRPRLRQTIEVQVCNSEGDTAFVQEADVPARLREGCVQTDAAPRVKRKVSYESYDGTTKRWAHFDLYGGLQFENCVQAVARDVMVEGMFGAEAAGYGIVLTVHDELLCDVPIGKGSVEELREIMATVPDWCPGLPLAAKTWEGFRYDK